MYTYKVLRYADASLTCPTEVFRSTDIKAASEFLRAANVTKAALAGLRGIPRIWFRLI